MVIGFLTSGKIAGALILGLAGLALAAKPPPPPAADADAESPALRALLERPVGRDPAQEFHLGAALATLGGAEPAAALRLHLLHAFLRQVAQQPLAEPTTVRAAIAAAAALAPAESDRQALERWDLAVNRSFAVVGPQATPTLPPELEASQKSLREIGPGLWSDHQADGAVRGYVWQATLRNAAALALPLAEFRLHPAGRHSPSIVFQCALPRYAESSVPAAGQDMPYLCRAASTIGPAHPAYAALVRQFSGLAPAELRIEARELLSRASTDALVLRLEAQARPLTEAWLAAHADCSARGDCAPEPAVAAGKSPLAFLGDPRWARIRADLHIAGTALGMLFGYAFLVRLIGRGGASVVAVVLGWIGAASLLLRGWDGQLFFTSGSYLGSPGAFFAPIFLIGFTIFIPLVLVSLISVVHELVFGDRASVLRDMGRAVIKALAEGLVELLLGRRRRR